jgi:hypothetical protein
MMTTLLAFTPFYDPLPALFPGMSDYWLWLVIPLVVAVSTVYKCTRIDDLRKLPAQAGILTFQLLLAMVICAILLAVGYTTYIRLGAPFLH